MPDYAQMNPGLHHVGYRFTSPLFSEKLPEEVKDMVQLRFKTDVVANNKLEVTADVSSHLTTVPEV